MTNTSAETYNGKPPRARVYLDFIGWNVKITGRHVVRHAHWTWQDALNYANLATANARREWRAIGCWKCKGRGYLPDWTHGLSTEPGEPSKKACPECQEGTP